MKALKYKEFDEYVYIDKCKCGLEIYVLPNKKVNKFFATLNVKYGSIDNEFEVNNKKYKLPTGIAHFLEHQMFTEPDGSSVNEKFAKLSSYDNAATSYDYTSYEFFGTKNIKENIDILLNYVYTPYFIEKNVNKEKGIICEEIKMYEDSTQDVIYNKSLQNVLFYSKEKNNVGGTIEDVKKTTASDLYLAYNTYYHPKNMFIIVTGNVVPEEVIAAIKENMDSRTYNQFNNPKRIQKKEPLRVKVKKDKLYLNIDIPRVIVLYKIDLDKILKSDLSNNLYLYIIRNLLIQNFGSNSELFEELKDKNLVNFHIHSSVMKVNNVLIIKLSAKTQYPNELCEIIKEKMKNITIDKKDLDILKRCRVASEVSGFDYIVEKNEALFNQILYQKKLRMSYQDDLDKITLNKINKYIKIINSDNISELIVYPKKEFGRNN